MQAINNINLNSLIDTVVSLTAAFILGGLIGFERQYRQRTAGLRTNVLVAVGARIFSSGKWAANPVAMAAAVTTKSGLKRKTKPTTITSTPISG
ncbi:MgtC/SapB family protein, partial [Pseudomonas sp. TNT11]